MPEKEPQFFKPEEVTEREKEPEYQKLKDVSFEEVKKGDPDFKKAEELLVDPGESEDKIREKLEEKIKAENWWLQEYWQKKGIPKEQIEIAAGDKKLNVYSFAETLLADQHLEILEKVIKEFSQIKNGEILNEVKYILIDNIPRKHPKTGVELNGWGAEQDRAIKIYPRGMRFIPYRIEGVSNFEGIVIHELSHAITKIDTDFENEWKNKFGWAETKKGDGWKCKYPEKCVNDYAKKSYEEDIPESVVAALRNQKALDPEKLSFIKNKLPSEVDVEKAPEVSIQRRSGNDIELPKVESPVRFKRRVGAIKFLNES